MHIKVGELLAILLKKHIGITMLLTCFISFLLAYLVLSRKGGGCSEPTIQIDNGNGVEDFIVADISGAIKTPGVYKLPEGSRVVDLLKLGGGALQEVSKVWISRELNLSTKLEDAQKVYVPFEWDLEKDFAACTEILPFVGGSAGFKPGISSEEAPARGVVNVNSAHQEELETLPRVGKVTAEKILDNRPFSDFNDFVEKLGFSQTMAGSLEALVVF